MSNTYNIIRVGSLHETEGIFVFVPDINYRELTEREVREELARLSVISQKVTSLSTVIGECGGAANAVFCDICQYSCTNPKNRRGQAEAESHVESL